ncbi:MAG: Gfo/Idh/MocA family oxidoreductase [Clostridiales bacterium]|nr:Gfo/Idh/MocA family oxidoreductase [Clostridiales bacterium]
MIRIAVSGVGRMGSYHLSVYERLMSEGYPVEVAAVCDVDPLRLDGSKSTLSNIAASGADITAYRSYTSLDELLEKEDIDAVDIVMPTYLHASAAEKVLLSGRHCMCEKPMALNADECGRMIAASGSSGKTLMIGHCLRFWREYVYLKRISDSGVYGASRAAVLWRGGFQDHEKSPSWQDWIITREKGGGGLFDQHIHDADAIRWIFGKPDSVSVYGRTVFPHSANDIVSANYVYPSKVIYAHDDITYKGLPFGYGFTVNFEHATLKYADGVLTVYPESGAPFVPDLSDCGETDDAYYNEMKYFLNCISSGTKPERCMPHESAEAVATVVAETESADCGGKTIAL